MNVSNELPKGWPGEYSTTFCTSTGISAAQYDLLIWQLTTSWTCTGLPYYKPLSFTHHTFTRLRSLPIH